MEFKTGRFDLLATIERLRNPAYRTPSKGTSMTKHPRMNAVRAMIAISLSLGLLAAACGSSSKTATTASTAKPAETTVTAAKAADFAADSTMAKIKAKGKIVIGTKFDQPLFGLKNPTTNEVEGFDAEIGKLLAKQIFGADIKGKVDFIETTSKVREESIEQGKVDIVVATYTINDARANNGSISPDRTTQPGKTFS